MILIARVTAQVAIVWGWWVTHTNVLLALLESPTTISDLIIYNIKNVIIVQQGATQRMKVRLFVRLVCLENTVQRLAQAVQHLVFNALKAHLAPQARLLAIFVQQVVIQQ